MTGAPKEQRHAHRRTHAQILERSPGILNPALLATYVLYGAAQVACLHGEVNSLLSVYGPAVVLVAAAVVVVAVVVVVEGVEQLSVGAVVP